MHAYRMAKSVALLIWVQVPQKINYNTALQWQDREIILGQNAFQRAENVARNYRFQA